MKKITIFIPALLFLLASPASVAMKFYKCVDEHGRVSFADRCPEGTEIAEEKNLKKKEKPEITVAFYFVPKCRGCNEIRNYFQEKGLTLEEKNVQENPELQDELVKKAGKLSVPTVVINDKPLSGYDPEALDTTLKEAGYQKEP
ncbi:MAG: glutaredoxin domain-containing protein [Gammaproteobacteria bacterium]|nr:glutaredoxin domain-containing protein [Gammaproteobacteria bacterium]